MWATAEFLPPPSVSVHLASPALTFQTTILPAASAEASVIRSAGCLGVGARAHRTRVTGRPRWAPPSNTWALCMVTGSTTLTRALEVWAMSPQRGDQSTRGPCLGWAAEGSDTAAAPTMVRVATTAILTSPPAALTLLDVILLLGKYFHSASDMTKLHSRQQKASTEDAETSLAGGLS